MAAKTKTIVNRKARFEYEFVDTFEAGIVLLGPEVKSLREGNANMNDAYCFFKKGELVLKNLFIAPYEMAKDFDFDARRDRKLLLKKRTLVRLEKKTKEKGFTIIPYKVYFADRGFVKVEIALAQGKKIHDKRQSLKDKDMRRDMERIKKLNI